jgi:phage gpG-like protein
MSFFVESKFSKGMTKALNHNLAWRGIQKGNTAIAKKLVKTARAGIRKPPKTGRVYTINGRTHRASAQGQYPANFTGDLQKSVHFEENDLEFGFGADTKYAPILQQYENAQQRNSMWVKIAPRPFLTLAHDTVMKDAESIMETSFKKVTGF